MDTTTFELTGTYSTASVLAFAKDKGYKEQLIKNQVNEDNTITQIVIPNPVSLSDFVADYFKNLIADDISQLQIQQLEQQAEQDLETKKQAVKDAVAQGLEIVQK